MSTPGPQHRTITPGMIRETLDRHGSFTFRAFGGSMMPVVRHGEMIRIEPLGAEQALAGDILFFATPDGRYIGHRFLGWRSGAEGERLMLTSGDTLAHLDPPHHPEMLLGRIAATSRRGRDVFLVRGFRSRVMALASRFSCRLASPLLALAARLPAGSNRLLRPAVRYLFCGPVFVLGALLRN
jgi:hypothetical protein